jgi:GTPase SAR1 family protein
MRRQPPNTPKKAPVFAMVDCRKDGADDPDGMFRDALEVGVGVDALDLRPVAPPQGGSGNPQGNSVSRFGGSGSSSGRGRAASAWDPTEAGYLFFGELPEGLSFEDERTGKVVGTPRAPCPGGRFYEIFARNEHGTVSVNWWVEINDAPPQWHDGGADGRGEAGYSADPATYELGRPIALNVPQLKEQYWPPLGERDEAHRVGRVTHFSAHGLPEGLVCCPSSGNISGTPQRDTPPVDVTVIAANGEWETRPGTFAHESAYQLRIGVRKAAAVWIGYSHDRAVYSVGSDILPNKPRLQGGMVDRFELAPGQPRLPRGLRLDVYSGILAGKPAPGTAFGCAADQAGQQQQQQQQGAAALGATDESGMRSWVVQAVTMVEGQALTSETTLKLRVVDMPPLLLAYSDMHPRYQVHAALAEPNLPRCSPAAGTPDSFATRGRPLPAGLILNPGTGAITGTPSQLSTDEEHYTIVATNSGGEGSIRIVLAVCDANPHIRSFQRLRRRQPAAGAGRAARTVQETVGGWFSPRGGKSLAAAKRVADAQAARKAADDHAAAAHRAALTHGNIEVGNGWEDMPSAVKEGSERMPDGMELAGGQERVVVLPLYDVRLVPNAGTMEREGGSRASDALREQPPHRPGEEYLPDVVGVSQMHGLRFSVVEGALPHGVALDPLTGAIKGMPNRAAFSGLKVCEAKVVASNDSGLSNGLWLRFNVLAERQGYDVHLAPADLSGAEPDYYKVILLGDSRTGKTSLLSSFSQHHDIRYQQEAQTPSTPRTVSSRRRSLFQGLADESGSGRGGGGGGSGGGGAGEPKRTVHPEFINVHFPHPDGSGRKLYVQLWDTVGQEKYGGLNLGSSHFRRADGVLLVFDVGRKSSFMNLEQWLSDLDNKCDSDSTGFNRIPTMLVMNKVDLLGKLKRVGEGGGGERNADESEEAGAAAGGGEFVDGDEVQEFREKHGINMFAKTSAKYDSSVQAYGDDQHPPPNHSVHAAITMLCHRVYMRKFGMDFSHQVSAQQPGGTPPRGFKLGQAERERERVSTRSRCCNGAA